MRLAAYFPLTMTAVWHSHICLSLCEGMQSQELAVELVSPTIWPEVKSAITRPAVPPRFNTWVYRAEKHFAASATLGQLRYRSVLARSDAAYLWAAVPLSVYRQVKERGLPLFVERINCHRQTAKRLLDRAYAHADLPPRHSITEAAIAEENEKLTLADYIFAPSPAVRDSLLTAGVPSRKILCSSYGWSPARIRAHQRSERRGPFTVLFVGTLCIRKGAHLLLEAWARADLPDAKLVLCGEVEPDIAKLCAEHLRRPDVDYRGYVADVGAVYAEADALALPTVEEGSPLVVYEALAAGLVPIVSPMGAGEIVRDGVEGSIVDPYEPDQLVAVLRKLAADRELCQRLQSHASSRARQFVWKEVATQRRKLLLNALAAEPRGSRTSAEAAEPVHSSRPSTV